MNNFEVTQVDRQFGAQHYGRTNLVVRRAEGCYLFDSNGRKYLDCLAAYSAANIGHHHSKVVRAVMLALTADKASVVSNVVYTDTLSLFLKKVATLVPQLAPNLPTMGNKVLAKNSGAESVETAIKAMRYLGWKYKNIKDGEQEIIVFDNSFHGRTTAIVSASTTDKYNQGFGGRSKNFISVPFGDLDAVRAAVTPNTCGILVEPYQGEGGMNIPPEGFLAGLREIADKESLFLTFDEIQVGLGRTGKLFCFQHENVIPDGLILGKAISGGLVPLSVFVAHTKVMDSVFSEGSDGSTYGGYPLACAAGLAAIDVIENGDLIKNAMNMGKILLRRLENIASKSSIVKEVRGKGLFIGIELKNKSAMEVCYELLPMGVVTNDSHGHTIRISPPLTINKHQIEFLLDKLGQVLI